MEVDLYVVDADAHVAECDETFDFLSQSEQQYRPKVLRREDARGAGDVPAAFGVITHYWQIGGRIYPKQNVEMMEEKFEELPVGSLDLRKPSARLKDMDRQGVDMAVVFPNLFLIMAIRNPLEEMALARSYNRWMAKCCEEDPERLCWVALIAPRLPEASASEIRWAKENGASGVLLRGFEGDMTPLQSEFDPIFKTALDCDLPICSHIGHGSPAYSSMRLTVDQKTDPISLYVPTLLLFSALMRSDLHERFPGLRFGIIEVGSAWLPFIGPRTLWSHRKPDAAQRVIDAIRERNIYITCEEHEDLPDILRYAGSDNLVIGSDYGHPGDISDSIYTHKNFEARDDIDADIKKKIMSDNGLKLFGIEQRQARPMAANA